MKNDSKRTLESVMTYLVDSEELLLRREQTEDSKLIVSAIQKCKSILREAIKNTEVNKLKCRVQKIERRIPDNFGVLYTEEPFGPFIISLEMYEYLFNYVRPYVEITLKKGCSYLGNPIVETINLCRDQEGL